MITTDLLKERTGLKIKFSTLDELYALQDVLTELLPPRVMGEEEKPKTIRKATKAPKAPKDSAPTGSRKDEESLLAPADADATGGSAPTPGATDSFCGNKYRLQVLNPALCVGRKYDEANPIVGTRPSDDGANGIVYPETQCTKKPIPGSLLCTCCAKNETEYLKDPAKGPKRWYGRLDEPLLDNNRIVGSQWFLSKYPAGIEGARPDSAPEAKPKKVKKEKAPTAPPAEETAETTAPKAKKAPTPPPPTEEEPPKPKKAKKDKAPTPAPPPTAEEEEEEEPKPEAKPTKPTKASKKAETSVADSSSARDVEWVSFMHEGVPLIRNTKTNNCYQCDRAKHRLEDMVQRDKYEGKWRKGRLDPYAEEDEE